MHEGTRGSIVEARSVPVLGSYILDAQIVSGMSTLCTEFQMLAGYSGLQWRLRIPLTGVAVMLALTAPLTRSIPSDANFEIFFDHWQLIIPVASFFQNEM